MVVRPGYPPFHDKGWEMLVQLPSSIFRPAYSLINGGRKSVGWKHDQIHVGLIGLNLDAASAIRQNSKRNTV